VGDEYELGFEYVIHIIEEGKDKVNMNTSISKE